jgi:hypothetical protein
MKAARAGLSLAVGLGAVWAVVQWTGEGPPRVAERPPARVDAFAFHLDGRDHVYQWRFTQQEAAEVFGGAKTRAPVTADVDVGGELVLRALGNVEGGQKVGLCLTTLEPHRFVFLGKGLLEDVSNVTGREAEVVMRDDGSVTSVSVPAEAPEVYGRLVHLVVSELQVHVLGGTSWTVDETTQHGVVPSRFEVAAADGSGFALRRSRGGYTTLRAAAVHGKDLAQQLESTATASVSSAGFLRTLDTHEVLELQAAGARVVHSDARMHVELLRVTDARPVVASAAPVKTETLLDIRPSALAEKSMLLQRVGGMTAEKLLGDLDAHASSGRLPEHNKWLWQASGLLQQQPALCAELGKRFVDPRMSEPAKALVLDLLVGAGTPEAQHALVTTLSSEEARTHERFTYFLQRVGLLEAPTAETAQYTQNLWRSSEGDVHGAATYALGSVTGHLDRSGDHARASLLGTGLVAGLKGAGTPDDQVTHLEALGNAGLAEHRETVTSFTTARDARVRAAAAVGLRKQGGPDNVGTLVNLLADADLGVQRAAMHALSSQTLSSEDFSRMETLVRGQRISERNYEHLVNLLQPHLRSQPVVAGILNTILGQHLEDPTVKSRIRNLLGV